MSSTRKTEVLTPHRLSCYRCFRPEIACLCPSLRTFVTDPEIVILIHPRETKKAIGTARIVHLSVENSHLIRGEGADIDEHPRVRAMLEDPSRRSVVLFPGPAAIDIDGDDVELEKLRAGPPLRVFVIDGTWSEARKMILRSRKLSAVPQIRFQPHRPSTYRIRRQPKPGCVSTLEAVHALLERAAEKGLGTLPPNRAHDNMLRLFDVMVEFQLRHIQPPKHPRKARGGVAD